MTFETSLPRPSTALLILALGLASWTSVGCDDDAESGQTVQQEQASQVAEQLPERRKTVNGVDIVFEAGEKPTSETVLAEADDIEITLADFERAMKRSMLVAPDTDGAPPGTVPADKLAVPQVQMAVVRRLLTAGIIRKEARSRGIDASLEEKRAALESHPRLGKYADILGGEGEIPDALSQFGLARSDLSEIAGDVVLRRKLQKELVEDIDDEQMWEAYTSRNNTVKLLLAWARNTPRSSTLDAYLREQSQSETSEIREHFRENARRYRRPSMVEVVTLTPRPGEDVDEQTLAKASRRLEEEADYESIADELDLVAEEDVAMIRQENPRAFGADEGTTGYETDGPRGQYAWRVTGRQEQKEAELTSSLERQIAAEILRREDVVPSAAARLTKIRRAFKDLDVGEDGELSESTETALREKAQELGLTLAITDHFPLTERGYIPDVGLAPEVIERVQRLSKDDPLARKPVLSRGRAYTFRLLDRHVPSREAFRDQKDEFAKAYRREQRRKVISSFVSRWESQHEVEMNLKPLRVEFGVAQKDGAAR